MRSRTSSAGPASRGAVLEVVARLAAQAFGAQAFALRPDATRPAARRRGASRRTRAREQRARRGALGVRARTPGRAGHGHAARSPLAVPCRSASSGPAARVLALAAGVAPRGCAQSSAASWRRSPARAPSPSSARGSPRTPRPPRCGLAPRRCAARSSPRCRTTCARRSRRSPARGRRCETTPRLAADARRDLVETICDEAERLERLVANLFDMTRLDSGRIELRREWIPLEEIVGSTLARLERPLAGREVRVDLARDLPLAWVDPILVEQLLANLLENAVKYAPTGPIEIEARRAGNAIELCVSDRGPGMPDGAPRARVREVRAGPDRRNARRRARSRRSAAASPRRTEGRSRRSSARAAGRASASACRSARRRLKRMHAARSRSREREAGRSCC